MLKTWVSFYTESLHKSFQKGLIWQTFDPKLQTLLQYTDISAISVTFRNSVPQPKMLQHNTTLSTPCPSIQ